MKKIGIVIPIYNTEPYLKQCINSILQQTYTNWELMLVDDGSTDNSGKICDEFAKKDKRIHVIHQSNQGKLPARYNGLNALKCDYATFVDSDDWIAEDTYKKMSQYMNQGIDMITFQIIRYLDESYHFVHLHHYEKNFYDKKQIELKIFNTMIWDISKKEPGLDASLCNKLVKRNILFKELYNARNLIVSYGDDAAVTYPLVTKIHSLMITDESLYYHRQRKQTQITPYFADSDYYKKLYLLYEYLFHQLDGNPMFVKQLDYFYTESTRLHLRVYGDKKLNDNYLFPFDRVPAKKRLILYGASILGQTFYEQIQKIKYGEVVAWVDQNYESYKELGVKDIEYIKTVEFYDYIVIAIINQEVSKEVKKNLINMNVREDKIIISSSDC